MHTLNIFLLTVAIATLSAPVHAQGILQTPQQARAWYIQMMVDNGCEMTAQEIDATFAAAFPYSTAAGQHDTGMITDAAFSIFSDGLIEQTGFNQVRYIGPEC